MQLAGSISQCGMPSQLQAVTVQCPVCSGKVDLETSDPPPRPQSSTPLHGFVNNWSSAEGTERMQQNMSGLHVAILSLTGTVLTTV